MEQVTTPSALLWFRRQLRLHDQPLFEVIDPDQSVCGIFILDPREHLAEVDGTSRTGSNRMRFLLESVAELRTALAALGVELLIRVGHPESVLPELVDRLEVQRVHYVEEPGTEERSVERAVLSTLGDRARPLPLDTLLEMEDPRSFAAELPEVFSRFRRVAEKKMQLARPRAAAVTMKSHLQFHLHLLPLSIPGQRSLTDPSKVW